MSNLSKVHIWTCPAPTSRKKHPPTIPWLLNANKSWDKSLARTTESAQRDIKHTFKMYFISKLIPLLILPLGLTLIFLIIFAKKKSSILLVPTIFLSFFSNGIVSELLWRYIESPWERLSLKEMPKADAIVVLSQKRHSILIRILNKMDWHPKLFLTIKFCSILRKL